MKERIWGLVIALGTIGICLFSITASLLTIGTIERQQMASRCSPQVGAFSQAKLVGTWVAGDPENTDTLIIRADRTYKQLVRVKSAQPPIDYESDWQPWHLEYSADNIPYLHLTGMRFCGMNPDIACEKHDGGGYDFCQDKYLPMNGEGILIVLSHSLHYPLGSENSYVYDFQEP